MKETKMKKAIVAGALLATVSTSALATVDEIVVTARKKAEDIQSVPVAITAVTSEELKSNLISDTTDLDALTPNVQFMSHDAASQGLLGSIRGVGYAGIEKTSEPTVGVSLDGVFLASLTGADTDLFDVDSVQILRGPQGTMFGRNTVGGVIIINRSKPTGDNSGKVEITFGDNDLEEYRLVQNLPFAGGGIKFTGSKKQNESFIYNTTLGRNLPHLDETRAGVAVDIPLSETTDLYFTWDNYNDNKTNHSSIWTSGPSNAMCLYYQNCSREAASAATNYTTSPELTPSLNTIQGNNAGAVITYDGDGYTLKATSGFQTSEEVYSQASWGLPFDLYAITRSQQFDQYSQEFTVTTDNYVVGAYFLETDGWLKGEAASWYESTQELSSRAIFGEYYWNVDAWEFALGARYTEEEKDFEITNAAGTFNGTFEDDAWTYRATATREVANGIVYGSYSTGFRSGGWNARAKNAETLGPVASEYVTTYELGTKLDLTDKISGAFTVFSSDYEDKQEEIITAGCGFTCTYLRNAGQVSIDGAELELTASLTDTLSARASVGILDATYDEYNYNGTDISDVAEFLFIPEETSSLGVTYAKDDFTATVNYSHMGETWGYVDWAVFDKVNGSPAQNPAYDVVDVNLTWTMDDGYVTLWGKDVGREGGRILKYADTGFGYAALTAREELGITFGITY
jgi:iron complex outermembrane receptor protein